MNDMQDLNRAGEATPVTAAPNAAALFKSYAISAALFSGAPDALYERRLKYAALALPGSVSARLALPKARKVRA